MSAIMKLHDRGGSLILQRRGALTLHGGCAEHTILPVFQSGCCGRMVSAFDFWAGGLVFKSMSGNLPLLKHTCGESERLLWDSPLVRHLCQYISCMPLPSANKAAHSGFETQRRCYQVLSGMGYQWPQKWTCVQQNFLKKQRKPQFLYLSIWKHKLYLCCFLLSHKISQSYNFCCTA